jgi:antitoxin Phd
MITKSSTEVQNNFGEMLDIAQREPIAITRHGRIVAFMISARDMEEFFAMKKQTISAAKRQPHISRKK